MKQSMQYIKLEGTLRSRGEREAYDQNRDIYGYDNVTIVDKDGREVFFKWLGVPVRLDDAINSASPDTFFILQSKGAQNDLRGLLYAAKSGEKKLFYRDGAVEGLTMFGLAQSSRVKLYRGSGGAVGMLTLALIVGIALGVLTGLGLVAILGIAGTFVFMMWPTFMRKKRINLDETLARLKNEGFDITP